MGVGELAAGRDGQFADWTPPFVGCSWESGGFPGAVATDKAGALREEFSAALGCDLFEYRCGEGSEDSTLVRGDFSDGIGNILEECSDLFVGLKLRGTEIGAKRDFDWSEPVFDFGDLKIGWWILGEEECFHCLS